jgi:hypothetical protein
VIDHRGPIPNVEDLRIPVRYLANMLTAGNEEPIILAPLIVFLCVLPPNKVAVVAPSEQPLPKVNPQEDLLLKAISLSKGV